MSEWKEFRVPVPWGEIAGREYGEADGEPWIVLHGWLDNCGSFERLVPLLAHTQPDQQQLPSTTAAAANGDDICSTASSRFCGRRMLCMDSPGHGLSSHFPPGMEYNMVDSVTDIRRVATHFKLDKFSLMGHSLGGMVCSLFAAMHPDMTQRLVILDVVSPTPKSAQGVAQKARDHLDSFLKNEALSATKPPKVHSYSSAKARMLEGNTNYFGADNLTPEALECLVPRGIKEVGVDQFIFTRDMRLYVFGSFHHLTEELLLDFAKSITCPHLTVICKRGLLDEERKKAVQPILDQFRKSSKFKMAEIDSTHHAHLTEPNLVAQTINDFLCDPDFSI